MARRAIVARLSFGAVNIGDLLKRLPIPVDVLTRLHFGPGVVGRTTLALVVSVLVLGVAIFSLRGTPELVLIAALAVVVMFLVYFAGVMAFAWKNPEVSVLEGAQFLALKQAQMATKGFPTPPDDPQIIDPRSDRPALPPGE